METEGGSWFGRRPPGRPAGRGVCGRGKLEPRTATGCGGGGVVGGFRCGVAGDGAGLPEPTGA